MAWEARWGDGRSGAGVLPYGDEAKDDAGLVGCSGWAKKERKRGKRRGGVGHSAQLLFFQILQFSF